MAHDRKFRFGVIAPTSPGRARSWREQARARRGPRLLDALVPDHFVDHPLAPMPALALAAAATNTLRVGTLVLGNDYKHPVVLAKEAATLDLLSDGRLELGIGAGWMTRRLRAAPASRSTRAGVRIARLAESLAIVKGALGRRAVHASRASTTRSRTRRVTRSRCSSRTRRSHRRRRPQDAAARRRARPTSSASTPTCAAGEIGADAAHDSREDHRRRRSSGSAKARATGSTTSSCRSATARRDHRRRVRARRALAPLFGVTADEALASGVVLAGTVDEVCDTLERRREEWGVSYVVVGDDAFERSRPSSPASPAPDDAPRPDRVTKISPPGHGPTRRVTRWWARRW